MTAPRPRRRRGPRRAPGRSTRAGLWPAALVLLGCAQAADLEVSFRVSPAQTLDPYAGADDVCAVLEGRDGAELERSCLPLDAARTVPSLDGLAFGEGLRVRVDTVDRRPDDAAPGTGVLVARGRSFPFAVNASGLVGSPDVLLGPIGRFAPLAGAPPWTSPPVALARTPVGALVATLDGAVWRYEPHPPAPDAPRFVLASTSAERAGARHAVFADGALLAVGGAEPGATLHAPDGRVVAILDDAVLAAHRLGATVVVAPGADHALVYGGAPTPDAPPTVSVTRITRLASGGLRASFEAPLQVGLLEAAAVVLPDIADAPGASPRALLLGGARAGGATSPDRASAIVVEPAVGVPSPRYARLARPVPADASVTAFTRDLALLVGGLATEEDPARDARVLEVLSDGTRVEDLAASPVDVLPPGGLRRPAVAQFGEGLVLVAGGLTPGEAGVADAWVVYVDRFSIEVEPVAPAPEVLAAPLAAALADGTVLVVDPLAALVWFPSREP